MNKLLAQAILGLTTKIEVENKGFIIETKHNGINACMDHTGGGCEPALRPSKFGELNFCHDPSGCGGQCGGLIYKGKIK